MVIISQNWEQQLAREVLIYLFLLRVFVKKGAALSVLFHSACPDPVSHGLIGAFECEAASRLALPASAAICL